MSPRLTRRRVVTGALTAIGVAVAGCAGPGAGEGDDGEGGGEGGEGGEGEGGEGGEGGGEGGEGEEGKIPADRGPGRSRRGPTERG